jgi:hypothetical protein
MYTKFRISVPGSKVEQEVENNFIVIGREESLKYWNSALAMKGTIKF